MNFGNLKLVSVGSIDIRENFIHPEKTVPLYELLAVTRGTVHICEDYNRYSVGAGEVILLDKNKSYYGYRESSENVSVRWLGFDSDIDLDVGFKTVDIHEKLNTVIDYFRKAEEQFWSYEHDEEIIGNIIKIILKELYKLNLNTSRTDDSAPLNEICRWIYENCRNNIKTTDVAKKFSYNEDYLTRIFKSNLGMGVKNYIDGAKMQYIKKLLCNPNISLHDVPSLCGFANYRSFLMFFNYHENITPTQYRKMNFIT